MSSRIFSCHIDSHCVPDSGSGVGLPTWVELLQYIALEAGMPEEERERLKTINYLDQARILELHLGGERQLVN